MRILVIDASNLWCRFFHARTKPEMSEQEATNIVLRSSLERIKRWVAEYRTDKVVLCFDRKSSSSKRKSIYPSYKEGRGNSDNEVSRIAPGMKRGISIFEKLTLLTTDYEVRADNTREADDLPGDFINEENMYYLISADLDWFRYVSDNVLLNNYNREYIGKDVRHDKAGCKPHTLITYKIIHGDSSDNVKPIKPYITSLTKGSLVESSCEKIRDILGVSQELIDQLITVYGRDTDESYLEVYQSKIDLDEANHYLSTEGLETLVQPRRRGLDIRDMIGL